jgi:hypothetical protein
MTMRRLVTTASHASQRTSGRRKSVRTDEGQRKMVHERASVGMCAVTAELGRDLALEVRVVQIVEDARKRCRATQARCS